MAKPKKFTDEQFKEIIEDFNTYANCPLLWDELSRAINNDECVPDKIWDELAKMMNSLATWINKNASDYQLIRADYLNCKNPIWRDTYKERMEKLEKIIERQLKTYKVFEQLYDVNPDDPEKMFYLLHIHMITLKRWAAESDLGQTRASQMYKHIESACRKIVNTGGKKGVKEGLNFSQKHGGGQGTNSYHHAMHKRGYPEIKDLAQEVYMRYIYKVGYQTGDGNKFRSSTYMKKVIASIMIDILFKEGSKYEAMKKSNGGDALENIYPDEEKVS